MHNFTTQSRQLLLAVLLLLPLSKAAAEITFPNSVFEQLDYGLYWFGYVDADKAVPGQLNRFYAPNKPTVIYIHGWQNGATVDARRETLDRRGSGGPAEDLSQYWLDRGWNVGLLYWNQFADEGEVKDAEAKIYTASGPRDMRWRKLDGSYASGPNKNVTTLLYEAIRDNMGDFSHSTFRLTGHSLGNQLALSVGKALDDAADAGQINANLRPDRIGLLDGFFSNWGKSYLGGRWTGEVGRDYADQLIASGVVIEAYRSSPTSGTPFVGDANNGLLRKTAFSELRPWNFAFWQLREKHLAAVTWYFWSMAFDAPQIRRGGGDAPSATTSNNRIQFLMNQNYAVRQDRGAYTGSPADDRFRTRSKP